MLSFSQLFTHSFFPFFYFYFLLSFPFFFINEFIHYPLSPSLPSFLSLFFPLSFLPSLLHSFPPSFLPSFRLLPPSLSSHCTLLSDVREICLGTLFTDSDFFSVKNAFILSFCLSHHTVTSTVFESKDEPTQMTKQSFTIIYFITYKKTIHFKLIC